eukprot:12931582-Prorocentrum_lima.AAC.1
MQSYQGVVGSYQYWGSVLGVAICVAITCPFQPINDPIVSNRCISLFLQCGMDWKNTRDLQLIAALMPHR